jgi:hypothetical protein
MSPSDQQLSFTFRQASPWTQAMAMPDGALYLAAQHHRQSVSMPLRPLN